VIAASSPTKQKSYRWLKKMDGKISNGLRIVRAGLIHGYPLWRLE
jgi:hypothetical protein